MMESASCRGKLTPKLGVVVFSSPLEVGAARAEQAVVDVTRRLESIGCKTVHAGVVDDPQKATQAGRHLAEAHVAAVVMVSACWFEDYLALDFMEECPAPLLLWSLPGMETGALCGMQQLSHTLKNLNVQYQTIYGHANDEKLVRPVERFAAAAALRYRLRRARIGLAGNHVSGMCDAAVNEAAMKKAIGPRVVSLDLPGILGRAAAVPAETAAERWRTFSGRAGKCSTSAEEGLDSMKVLIAFEEEIEKHALDAAAVGCYPYLMGRVCLAASALADRGIPLACEGDVNAAVGQLMLTLLTGRPTHNTDWLEPLADGTVIFSHCGNGSFCLAEKPELIELSHVRLMDRGACALFTAKPGPVTLVNLVPQGGGYQLALLEGEAISTEMVFPGNPLRVQFNIATATIQDWIHQHGIGHHWMAGYGHLGGEIKQWAQMAGPDLTLLQEPQ